MNILLRIKQRLFSLPGRILIFNLVSTSLVSIALIIIFIGVRSLVMQFNQSEQERVSMEAARLSAQQVEQSRALLMEMYATGVRGDLDQLLIARNQYYQFLPELIKEIEAAGLQSELPELQILPEKVLNATEALLKKDVPASTAIMANVDSTIQALAHDLNLLYTSQKQQTIAARMRAIDALQQVSGVVVILLITAVSVSLLLTIGVERLIRRPLERIFKSINGIVLGETWVPFRTGHRYDEIGRIHAAINALHERELERCEVLKQLEFQARYDVLTGLPNRILLQEQLQTSSKGASSTGTMIAIAVIDLDDFKWVNDQFGHEFGDQILQTIATRLTATLPQEDILGRLGGDEFVAILSNLATIAEAERRIKSLLESIRAPLHYADSVLRISASAGVSIYPQAEEVGPEQLIRQADTAMYGAKQTGRNNFTFFNTGQDQLMRERHAVVADLRNALENRQLKLLYQPKVNLSSGEIVGVEALIRWQHPDKGLLSPNAFLPAVENHLLALTLGEWVLRQAIQDCETWKLAGRRIPVAINLFPLQLQDDGFVEKLKACLADHPNVSPQDIELEIVETVALDDLDKASQVIRESSNFGIHFALDDFGTGYSSLTYLRKLPINILKIDQSFVRGMLDEEDDVTIVRAVLTMAQAFGLDVVAEGVETAAHGTLLIQLGCRFAQGYAIAKPMPAEQLLDWSVQWRLPPEWRGAGNRSGI